MHNKQMRSLGLLLLWWPSALWGSLTTSERAAYTAQFNSTHFTLLTPTNETIAEAYLATLADSLEVAYGVYVDDLGFSEPQGGVPVSVYVHAMSAYGSASTAGYMELDDALSTNHNTIYKTPAHELFHLIQYASYRTVYEIFSEGLCRWAEDLVYDSLNTYALEHPGANTWIGKLWDPGSGFAYGFSLFWKYTCEQLSTMPDPADSAYGTDVIQSFFSYFDALGRNIKPADIEGALNAFLGREYGQATTMAAFYKSFLLAVYAKDLGHPFMSHVTGPSGNPRWDFLEDEEAPYATCGISMAAGLSATNPVESFSNVGYTNSSRTEGFAIFGAAEPCMIELDPALEGLWFHPTPVDTNGIHYAAAIEYKRISTGAPHLVALRGLNCESQTNIALYGSLANRWLYAAQRLILIPFTLDDYPYDGTGNVYQCTVAADLGNFAPALVLSETRPAYLLQNSGNELVVVLENFGHPLAKVKLTLSTDSEYVTMSGTTAYLGALATGGAAANGATPFKFQIATLPLSVRSINFSLRVSGFTLHGQWYCHTIPLTLLVGW